MVLHFKKTFIQRVLLFFWLSCAAASAAKINTLKDGSFVAYATVDAQYAKSLAGQVTGAVFSEQFNYLYSGNAGIGWMPFRPVMLGVRYEYWLGRQVYAAGQSVTDTLKLQAAGLEMGYRWGNPRAFFVLWAGVFYPWECKIQKEAGTPLEFTRQNIQYYYQARLQISVKFNSLTSIILEFGYRKMNLGNLRAGSIPFISTGDNLDFSGPFGGLGIGFHF